MSTFVWKLINSSLLHLHYEAVLLRGGDGHQLRGVEAGAQQPGLGPRHLPGKYQVQPFHYEIAYWVVESFVTICVKMLPTTFTWTHQSCSGACHWANLSGRSGIV